jgi:hypothetical protein
MILCAVSSGTFWGCLGNAHADHMFDKCFSRNIILDFFFLRCGLSPPSLSLKEEGPDDLGRRSSFSGEL